MSETQELAVVQQSPMTLLQMALSHNAGIDVIERLAALQDKERARLDEIDFNDAMNRVQEKIRRIAPDLENPQKRSKYASYAAIDRVVRPIYAAEGFSLSFTHAECPKPEHIRVIGRLALRGHKEFYQVDWPVDTKGPKGEPVMTATQATGASDSYAKRYLVKDIWNIAIGELDTDGELESNGDLMEAIEWIENCKDADELRKFYKQGYEKFEANPAALKAIIAAKNEKRKEF